MAHQYAIRDLDQAWRYLADPILGRRVRQDVRRMMGNKGKSASDDHAQLAQLRRAVVLLPSVGRTGVQHVCGLRLPDRSWLRK
jgi:uncharacterized protein (DUF1810 family)